MDAAAIHVHTADCAHFGPPNGGGAGTSPVGSPRASSPARDPLPPLPSLQSQQPPLQADHGFECDFHCCALHEEGRRIAVHKSVATSPIQECHHTQPPSTMSVGQPTSSLSDGTRRASPKGHVRFLDADASPPLPPPPLLPPSPPALASSPVHRQYAAASGNGGGGRKQQHQHRTDDSSESETETTVIEDDSMTSEKFLLLIDQLTGKQDKHLTVKDIGIILERLNSKIVDVERLDRDYEATDCYNWTIKATIRGDVLQELGIIYNGNYYGISEHPGYRQNEEEMANDEEALEEDEEEGEVRGAGEANCRDDHHRRRAEEEVNI